MQQKNIVENSFPILVEELEKHIADGWQIDPNIAPEHDFMVYNVSVVKEDIEQDGDAVVKKPLGRPARKAAQ